MKGWRSFTTVLGWLFLASALWMTYASNSAFPTSTSASKPTVQATPTKTAEPKPTPVETAPPAEATTGTAITPDAAKVPLGTPRTMPKTLTVSNVKTMLNQLTATYPDVVSYNRGDFKHWVDADKNGCNSRMEVLKIESLKKVTVKAGTTCTIATGEWFSAYEGKTITSAGSIDIDHMVPLKEAALSGAYRWDAKAREAYANDLGYPGSLIAVSATTNRSKSDQDPNSWLPPSTTYRCTYAAVWTSVKWRWQLTIDPSEKTKLSGILSGCKDSDIKTPTK
jgi:hypothetical protein